MKLGKDNLTEEKYRDFYTPNKKNKYEENQLEKIIVDLTTKNSTFLSEIEAKEKKITKILNKKKLMN